MPQRHPNTITSTSQPNPCLSHAPNSRIRCSMRKSPLCPRLPTQGQRICFKVTLCHIGKGGSLSVSDHKRQVRIVTRYLLYPRKQKCPVQFEMSAKGQ